MKNIQELLMTARKLKIRITIKNQRSYGGKKYLILCLKIGLYSL